MGVKRLLSLYAMHIRMDTIWFLRNARMTVISAVTDIVLRIASFSAIFLLALKFGGVGGMGQYEVLFMLGYSTMVQGLYEMTLNMNVGHISRRIGRGQVDHMLIQPVPIWAQLLTSGFMPVSCCFTLLTGAAVSAVALKLLAFQVGGLWLLSMAGCLLLSTVIMVSVSFLIGSSAFWWPAACEEISSSACDVTCGLSNYPLSGMAAGMRMLLISVLPSGLLGWFPAMLLLGRPPFGLSVWYLAAATGVFALAGAAMFKKGLRHYAHTGSFRYKPHGHRS